MATYWENSCSFGLRYVSWYKYLIVSLVFSHLGFWSGNLFLIAPFPDLCLLVPFCIAKSRMTKTQQTSRPTSLPLKTGKPSGKCVLTPRNAQSSESAQTRDGGNRHHTSCTTMSLTLLTATSTLESTSVKT